MEHFFQSAWAVAVEYWQTIVSYFFLVCSVLAAFVMGALRTAKETGKIDWIESGMCGVFAWGVWYLLGLFNLPDGAGVLAGGFIGHIGAVRFSNYIKQKLGIQND